MPQDAIETKVVSMLDALQNGAVEVAGQAVKYAPDVTNAMLDVIRIDNIQHLINGFMFLPLIILLIYIAKRFCKWNATLSRENKGFGLFCGGLVSAVNCSIVANVFSDLINVWTWVGIFQPKLYIAHLLVEKVMK